MASRPLTKKLWYNFLYILFRLIGVLGFRLRCWGRDRVPASGGGLVCANHQSNLDPAFVGLSVGRRLNFLARKSLFSFAPFRWFINSLDAIPIDRDGMGLGGIRETLRRLKRGELVLIFPEGTRTRDGEVGSLKPGFIALARRAHVPLIPVGFDGPFDAWPRNRRLPRPAVVHVHIGEPITYDTIRTMTDDELLSELHSRIVACQKASRQGRRS